MRFLEEEILSACVVVFGRRRPGQLVSVRSCALLGRKRRLRGDSRQSICVFFEGQRSSLFILPAQLDQRVCELSTPAGRLEHTWVDMRIHTFMRERADAQINFCLRRTHASLHTHTGREADAGGTHQQAITQHMHPPAHTHLFHFSPVQADSEVTLV